ncbi:hypothetical protein A3841_13650 [Pontibacter flavimaris]|uniref:Uncharacterized protein n=2 Tax=Pontibacter flavimaris TaxID=1797110 RepID=A0A1Q5PF90_9BACT|nr:hypothetical protein A3841_13650 [Pontibacter flavimaris]
MVAILLLCMVIMPTTQAYAETSNGTSAAAAQQVMQDAAAPQTVTAQGTTPDKEKPKATTTKPRERSVLDAEVLESPLAYFRDAFSSEGEESDTATGSNAVVVTLKALIATLLSTVI